MSVLPDYVRALQGLRDEHSGSNTTLLGFPGARGDGLPNVAPPAILFYCPGLLLLHDVCWIPDTVFSLDDDETRASVP